MSGEYLKIAHTEKARISYLYRKMKLTGEAQEKLIEP
jgi:hypothetical protein